MDHPFSLFRIKRRSLNTLYNISKFVSKASELNIQFFLKKLQYNSNIKRKKHRIIYELYTDYI